MSLSNRLSEYVAACFTGLWIQSHEHDDALIELAQLCQRESWALAVWDVSQGLQFPGLTQTAKTETNGSDPLAAIQSVNALASHGSSALVVLVNFHRFLGSAEIVQALARQISQGKQNRTFVVVLSPIVDIPRELDKLFVVIEHDLPNREQLDEIARGIATEPDELPEEVELQAVLDAAAGLTRFEAEGAFSLSLIRDGQLKPKSIWELKAQALKKSGLLSLYHGHDSFQELGGLENLKTFCLRAMHRARAVDPRRRPRGVLLLSPPGCGKSQFAKTLGNETGRPTLILDVGALMGSLVGQTESNIRQALRIADAMAPCVLMVDECEKGLSGAASSGQTDSGVSARLFGTFLTWLSDHESDVFVVCTANAIDRLPPEFARAERFDGVFFLDLPGAVQKARIWDIWLQAFDQDPEQPRPKADQWTGAEIRSCCRLASLLGLPLVEAAQNVVPVAVTARESVERLREWASGRCLHADEPGIYVRPGKSVGSRRRVARDPSSN